MPGTLSPNMEHYLQSIYLLQQKNKVARVKEIAHFMDVSMPSVTNAVKSLRDKKLVQNMPYGYIELTNRGSDTAMHLMERRRALQQFLVHVLRLNIEIAEDDACQIEHVISEEATSRLKVLMKLIEQCPKLKNKWDKLITQCISEEEGNFCDSCLDM
ncbi:MAG: hypothetical protein B6244_12045 [Candidatus Cloacimonetes bacterium 4572_55]|nr:MAG: hypothetical protein B6244_12045 [Candidatus Cloacimonetes bacterium 4572_55]